MNTFADAEVVLAEALPGYEERVQQQRLARAVEAVYANPANFTERTAPRHLFGQAGCGVGKSLGYAIPAMLAAAHQGRRTVISVTTKTLQDQLANKDIPFLQEHLADSLPRPVTFAVLKGRSNYVCLNRARVADEADVPLLPQILAEAEAEGFSGLVDGFSFEVPVAQRMQVSSDAEDCHDFGCKKIGGCFAEAARARARVADLVIVNHALLYTDMLVKGYYGADGMLGSYDVLVCDESHECFEIAANTLGSSFSEGSLRSLTSQIRNWAGRYSDSGVEGVSQPVMDVLRTGKALFSALGDEPGRLRSIHLNTHAALFEDLSTALLDLRNGLNDSDLEDSAEYAKAKSRKAMLQRRTNNTIQKFHEVITASFADLVRWIEVERKMYRGRWETRVVLRTAPVNVAPFLRENLYSQTPTIHVSATLAVKGSFDFMATRLGVDDFDGVDVGTPFSYPTQARLYVPTHLPAPVGRDTQTWEIQATEEIVDLLRISNGRALVLFTSLRHMRSAFESVSQRVNFPLLMQGQDSVANLSERFATETHSVLFGTKSFFTGFDTQGESLSLVVIAKMPFPVPTEPMTEARCDAIRDAGGNDFGEYTIPVMSLVLQQAAGRLIRHTTDMGVVAILDPRLVTKGYGRIILRDLPPMPLLKRQDQVTDFFAEVDAHYDSRREVVSA